MLALRVFRDAVQRYIVLLCAFCCLIAVLLVRFAPISTSQQISKTHAVELARAYSGLQSQPVSSACKVRIADFSIPFHHVVSHQVWQITFARVTIMGRAFCQSPGLNPHLSTLTLWIDAVDGSLLKAASNAEVAHSVQEACRQYTASGIVKSPHSSVSIFIPHAT